MKNLKSLVLFFLGLISQFLVGLTILDKKYLVVDLKKDAIIEFTLNLINNPTHTPKLLVNKN